MRILSIDKDKGLIRIRLFGITILRWGKRTGFYDMHHSLERITGVEVKVSSVQIQHGWYGSNCIPDIDKYKKGIDLMLFWNRRLYNEWIQIRETPSYIIGSPFVRYRRYMNITQNEDAKGTIAYPGHSISNIKAVFDLDRYCEELRNLPEEFHPITISLHPTDIRKYHWDKEFTKRGFKIYCAATDWQKPFYENFYNKLRQFKYATSNEVGSYLFYAVEMGTPFFMLGEEPVKNIITSGTHGQPPIAKHMSDLPFGRIATDLFTGKPKNQISREQRDYVLSELGMDDCLSHEDLVHLLKHYERK